MCLSCGKPKPFLPDPSVPVPGSYGQIYGIPRTTLAARYYLIFVCTMIAVSVIGGVFLSCRR